DHMVEHPEQRLEDVCFGANSGRSPQVERLAVSGESVTEVCSRLESFVRGESVSGVWRGQADALGKRRRVAFLFTGQGSQYVGMGRTLFETQPTFRAALERCAGILKSYLERPLLEVLYPAEQKDSPLEETRYAQPAL